VLSQAFPAVATRDARVLVLGTLPGPESLRQRQYYAHPRNAFWPIMCRLFGAQPELPYRERLQLLRAHGVALWDVCASAYRAGALDGAIRPDSIVVNDFAGFFRSHRQIGLICFNGGKAAELYRRHVLPGLTDPLRSMPRAMLPSTSPAYAAMTSAQKLVRWDIVRRNASPRTHRRMTRET
jgi:double-stranded uracil-DNA glycosylase